MTTGVMPMISQRQTNYIGEMSSIYGWLLDSTAEIISHTLTWQIEQGLRGDVAEIGTFHGKLFILLALSRAHGERAIGIDVFEDQHLNQDQSGFYFTQDLLVANLSRYLPMDDIDLIKADSSTLGPNFIRNHHGIRWMSIDGSHTRLATVGDLRLAERMVVDGGIVAVDDIFRVAWAGVTSGVYEYLHTGGILVPFAIIPNKLLLTTGPAFAQEYSKNLHAAFPHYHAPHGREWQNFFGTESVVLLKDPSDP
jgi:hypothetical protein